MHENALPLGWLSPNCVFHECQYHEHRGMAQRLAQENGLVDKQMVITTPDGYLLAAGWIKITRLLFLGDGKLLVCFPRDRRREKDYVSFDLWRRSMITPRHRDFFKEAYFRNPHDWEIQTILDFEILGILDSDEIISEGDEKR